MRGELDVLAQQPAQHRGDALHDFDGIENLGLEHLATAESQELAGERRGPICGGDHLVDVGTVRLVARQVPAQ